MRGVRWISSGLYLVADTVAQRLADAAGPTPSDEGPFSVLLPDGTSAELRRREYNIYADDTPGFLRRPFPRDRRIRTRYVRVWTLTPDSAAPPRLVWRRAPDGAPIWMTEPVTDALGRSFDPLYRVDARRRSGEPVRVDRGTFLGWEAIDNGGVRTVTKGRALAERHAGITTARRSPQRDRPARAAAAWRHALDLDREARRLFDDGADNRTIVAAWRAATDAWRVAADAFEEVGREDMAAIARRETLHTPEDRDRRRIRRRTT